MKGGVYRMLTFNSFLCFKCGVMATENSERNTPKEVSLKLCLESLCYKSFMHKAVINTKKFLPLC